MYPHLHRVLPGCRGLKWKLGLVEQGAEQAGRDPAQIDVWVRSILIVAQSKKAAFKEAASFLPGVGAARNYVRFRHRGYREEVDRMLKELDREQPGIVDEVVKIQEAFEPYAFEQLDNPPSKFASQRVVDFFNQTGTEDQVCEGIERLGEAGVKCIATATYTIIDKKAHLEDIGKRIVPRFQD